MDPPTARANAAREAGSVPLPLTTPKSRRCERFWGALLPGLQHSASAEWIDGTKRRPRGDLCPFPNRPEWLPFRRALTQDRPPGWSGSLLNTALGIRIFRLPEGRFGIAIGDVSGKGIGAALMMASLEASLRGQASVGHDLTELMKRVNSLVYEASSPNRYATLFYAEYDPRSRQLSYVNAGHNPPVILRKSAAACRVFRLETGGPVIGIIRQCYQQGSFPLEPGDLVVLFTDGVPESMNVRDEEWGEDRLIEFAKTCHDLPAFEAMTRILAAAEAFTGGASQHDDMTLVVLRVLT